MPSARNLSRFILGLLGCLGLAGLGLRCGPDLPEAPAKEGTAVEAVQESQEIQIEDKGRLESGRVVEATLPGGRGHRYGIEMQAGQYVHIVVEQKGVDVEVQLFTPTGEERPLVDSPNGTDGPEEVFEVAGTGGIYHLEVRADPSGDYSVSIVEAREAKEEDRMRSRASIRFAEAEELRREGTREGLQAALAGYQEALPVWQTLADRAREAATRERIGWVHLDLTEPVPAVDSLRKALSLYTALNDRKNMGLVHTRIGSALFDQGSFAEALEEHQRAVEIFRAMKAPYREAAALNNKGHAHQALGQTQDALDAHRQALSRALEGKNPAAQASAHLGIGTALTTQGKLDLALDSLQESLALENTLEAPTRRMIVLTRIAGVLLRMERFEEARKHLEQALAISKSIGDLHGEAVILSSLGMVLRRQNRLQEAESYYRQALEHFQRSGSSRNEAATLLNLGQYYYAAGDPQRAFKAHEDAAAVFRKLDDSPNEAATLFGSARALHDLGDYSGARDRLQKVLERIEHLREETSSTDLRTSYFATKQRYLDLYVDVLMHLHEKDKAAGWDGQALQINERRRARGLLDLLAEARNEIRKGADPSMIERERQLQEQVSSLEVDLSAAAGHHAEQQGKRQRALLAELDEVQTQIRRSSPRFQELTAAPLKIEEIQKKVLDRGSIMLVYSLGEERSFLWLLEKSGRIESHVLPARSLIDDMARRVYQAWSRRGGARRGRGDDLAIRLSEALLRPVAARLGSKRLVVVSDGALQYLPFGALPDPGEGGKTPLILGRQVVHLPSASVVAGLHRDFGNRRLAKSQVAVVADPVFSIADERLGGKRGMKQEALPKDLERSSRDLGLEGFERLPFTGSEVEVISDLIPKHLRFEAVGFEASRETVTSGHLKDYRVLHFATHGVLNEKHPDLSGLVLSLVDAKGRPQDGFLRGYEICGLDLNAELVVLSACQTGLGEDVRGEGLVGLTRSFMYAGAPRLVVSLWNVNDRSTAELMQRFYRGMYSHDLTPAAALRCAQISMMRDKRWNAPYHWAPFVFQGEWLSRLDGSQARDDEGIEVDADGTANPKVVDHDLPPPEEPAPSGCPEVL